MHLGHLAMAGRKSGRYGSTGLRLILTWGNPKMLLERLGEVGIVLKTDALSNLGYRLGPRQNQFGSLVKPDRSYEFTGRKARYRFDFTM